LSSIIAIRVRPRSARPGLGPWSTDAAGREELEVRVSEAPTEGSANDAVVKLLSKALGISRSEVTIISGRTSRNKRIAIPLGLEEARARLGV
jgi:hypothetical protein